METESNDKLVDLFREIAEVSGYLWERGWAERNAGNFSVNVTGLFSPAEREILALKPCSGIELFFPGLAGQVLLVSGTGKKMRDTARSPRENCCMVRTDDQGRVTVLQTTGHSPDPVLPTSELFTHLSAQQLFIDRGMDEKAFMHTHVTQLIALTQNPAFCQEATLNHLLWGMHPETLLFIPEGIGMVPHSIPGTPDIARKTLRALEKHKVVIWEKHGCLAAGKTLSDAFDLIDLAAKAVTIYFLCRRAGFEPEGLTEAQLSELRQYPPPSPPYL